MSTWLAMEVTKSSTSAGGTHLGGACQGATLEQLWALQWKHDDLQAHRIDAQSGCGDCSEVAQLLML